MNLRRIAAGALSAALVAAGAVTYAAPATAAPADAKVYYDSADVDGDGRADSITVIQTQQASNWDQVVYVLTARGVLRHYRLQSGGRTINVSYQGHMKIDEAKGNELLLPYFYRLDSDGSWVLQYNVLTWRGGKSGGLRMEDSPWSAMGGGPLWTNMVKYTALPSGVTVKEKAGTRFYTVKGKRYAESFWLARNLNDLNLWSARRDVTVRKDGRWKLVTSTDAEITNAQAALYVVDPPVNF